MGRIYVSVDVEADDVLFEIDTADLLKELEARINAGDKKALLGLRVATKEFDLAIDYLRDGRPADALMVFEAMTNKASNDVIRAYAAAKDGKHPFLKIGERKT